MASASRDKSSEFGAIIAVRLSKKIAQNAVDEACSLGAAARLGELHRFIDRGVIGNSVEENQLIASEAVVNF